MQPHQIKELGSLEKVIKAQESVILNEKKRKACLFNLVIDVEKTERLNYYLKVIKELIDQFPCRIFLVHFDREVQQPQLEYSLLTPKSAPQVVCDFIKIDINPSDYRLLSSLINANMVSDLPLFYMPTEHGDHLSTFTFEMAKSAKRVICDSTDVKDIDAYIHNITRLTSASIDVADLNWSRIESWREMIAKNLNNQLLSDLKSITIEYNHKKDKPTSYPFQAIFLKAFLLERLKLNLNKSIPITIKERNEEAIWEGAILSVTFFDHKGSKQEFIRNLNKLSEAVIHFESTQECFVPQYVQFTRTESGQSLIKEIRHARVSSDYLKIITHLKSFL